jgi:hypothetical protein
VVSVTLASHEGVGRLGSSRTALGDLELAHQQPISSPTGPAPLRLSSSPPTPGAASESWGWFWDSGPRSEIDVKAPSGSPGARSPLWAGRERRGAGRADHEPALGVWQPSARSAEPAPELPPPLDAPDNIRNVATLFGRSAWSVDTPLGSRGLAGSPSDWPCLPTLQCRVAWSTMREWSPRRE